MSKIIAKLQVAKWSLAEDRGATAVEYALIVGGIAVVVLGAVQLFGGGISDLANRFQCAIGLTPSGYTCPAN